MWPCRASRAATSMAIDRNSCSSPRICVFSSEIRWRAELIWKGYPLSLPSTKDRTCWESAFRVPSVLTHSRDVPHIIQLNLLAAFLREGNYLSGLAVLPMHE